MFVCSIECLSTQERGKKMKLIKNEKYYTLENRALNDTIFETLSSATPFDTMFEIMEQVDLLITNHLLSDEEQEKYLLTYAYKYNSKTNEYFIFLQDIENNKAIYKICISE